MMDRNIKLEKNKEGDTYLLSLKEQCKEPTKKYFKGGFLVSNKHKYSYESITLSISELKQLKEQINKI